MANDMYLMKALPFHPSLCGLVDLNNLVLYHSALAVLL